MRSVKTARISNPDVISDLPSNLTEHILICLPPRDAVRTSILSSKWRYKWLTIPRLVFNNQLCSKLKLPTAVYQVLQRHKGPMLGFVLYIKDIESSDVTRSSPNLQQLFIIGSVEKDDVVGPVVNSFRTPDCSNCSFNQLRKVTMIMYCGTEPELEFAKFLLANSMALETMHIWPNEADEPHGFKMLKELVQLRCASPKAKIIYGGDKEPCISIPL